MVLGPDVVIVTYPVRNGAQVLMPRRLAPRSCVRLDGEAKVAYASRADARRGRPKHEDAYRCRFCGAWHRATKVRTARRREVQLPVSWVRRRAA